jgi:hypothetical protein
MTIKQIKIIGNPENNTTNNSQLNINTIKTTINNNFDHKIDCRSTTTKPQTYSGKITEDVVQF